MDIVLGLLAGCVLGWYELFFWGLYLARGEDGAGWCGWRDLGFLIIAPVTLVVGFAKRIRASRGVVELAGWLLLGLLPLVWIASGAVVYHDVLDGFGTTEDWWFRPIKVWWTAMAIFALSPWLAFWLEMNFRRYGYPEPAPDPRPPRPKRRPLFIVYPR